MSDRCPTCQRPFPAPRTRCSCCGAAAELDPCIRCRDAGFSAPQLFEEVTHAPEAARP